MKAISRKQHKTIIATLQQLDALQQQGLLCADGFSLPLKTLSEQFSHYEALLAQLADCIAEYEAMYKEVKVNVVAPALRHARKQLNSKSTKAIHLREHLTAAQGF